MNFQTNLQGDQLHRSFAKSLPLLPGNTFNFNVGADRFHRAGHFAINQGARILSEVEGYRPRRGIGKDVPEPRSRPGIGGVLPPPWAPVRTGPDHSVFPKCYGQMVLPTWLEFDKKILVFDAYYQEPIPESRDENYRVHQCKIYYYLEDETIQVIEPKTLNAGLPQGQIIRRHRIPLPPPCEGQFYTLEHFNIGCEVLFYAKMFYICACDGFTRRFLNRLGIPVPHNRTMPVDCATEKLIDKKRSQFARKPHPTFDKRGPFILHSCHVLRFWGYWDDRCHQFGDLRRFILHYYLADGTIEIREIFKPNAGYELQPTFLRRVKVPKTTDNLVGHPGESQPVTVLNVFGSIYGGKSKKPHFMLDNLQGVIDNVDYIKEEDLAIGAVLNIYGRAIILTSCDEFTKQYYREKFKTQDFTPLELDEVNEVEAPEPKPPPYHGWGQEDDLGMWKNLEMKPAVKDFRQQAAFDKDILRFEARFYDALQSVNQSRRFTISYFMGTDEMQVFEKEHPNSGLPKGTFYLRSRVKKPGHQVDIGDEPEFYGFEDLFIGNILKINNFTYQLINADEFTLSFMEKHKGKFPHANLGFCLAKVKEAFAPLDAEQVVKMFAQNDTCLQGVIDKRSFNCLLMEITQCGLSEHEVMTLSRAYACLTPPPGTDFQTLQAISQTELRKNLYDRLLLARIEYTFRYHDPCRSGRVDRETLRATLKGAKVPLFKDLLDFLVDKFPSPEDDRCNQVDYCQFLKFLDWETNPAPIARPAAIQCVMKWVEPKPPLKILCVNYRAFLEDVCPTFKTALPTVCCCQFNKPCPQHPLPEIPNYCPENKPEEDVLPPCGPQEPYTVVLQPCSVTQTGGNSHRCAPGAMKCNAYPDEDDQDQEQNMVPTFSCPPCSGAN